jgi:hypothetical protein
MVLRVVCKCLLKKWKHRRIADLRVLIRERRLAMLWVSFLSDIEV